MDNKIKNYIFDLDGTVINSCDEVLKCFEKTFQILNYPINQARLTSELIGPPLKEIVQNIVPELNDENMLNKITETFREIYDNDTEDESVLYEGVYDKLTELKRNGKNLFLATLKPTKPTIRIIKSYKLNMFEDIYTIDKFGNHITKKEMIDDILNKYNLKKDETVMVGDALSDVTAANESGVTSIGALWGYGKDKTNLIKHSKYVIKNIKEL